MFDNETHVVRKAETVKGGRRRKARRALEIEKKKLVDGERERKKKKRKQREREAQK